MSIAVGRARAGGRARAIMPASWPSWPGGWTDAAGRRVIPASCSSGPPNAGKSRLFNALLGPRPGDRLAAGRYDPRLPDRALRLRRPDGRAGRHGRDRGVGATTWRPWPRFTASSRPTAPTCSSTAGRPRGAFMPSRKAAPGRASVSGRVATRRRPSRSRRVQAMPSRPAPRPGRALPSFDRRSRRPSAPAIPRATCPPGRPRDAGAASSAPRRRCDPPRTRSWPEGGDELVAFDIRLAAEELGRVVGAVVTDDILDRIFRRFCIGK